jgi:secernin
MCDSWVALRDATRTRQVIFAKNSDRPIFDCQPLLLRPRQSWPAGSRVDTTYLSLPQVPETYAHLGASPYWCWGYEAGVNEHGVVIGNEAVFTKSFAAAAIEQQHGNQPALGLLGMDMLRLALERTTSAQAAVDLIGGLVEAHGQFGSGVPTKDDVAGGYDNSFLVADAAEAWVLETTGRQWAARRVQDGCASISNQLSLRQVWDRASPDVQHEAARQGWWAQDAAPFDFARAYTDDRVARQVSHIRARRSAQLLAEQAGQITPGWMKRIARDHYEDTFLQGPYFDAADPDFLTLCMHVSPADFTWGHTASSCVTVLPSGQDELPVFWWTPGPPCNGCYVPFFAHGSRLPASVSRAGTAGQRVTRPEQAAPDSFAPDSYWWLFRRLMDVVKGDAVRSVPGHYPERNRRVRAVFDGLEAEFEAALPGVLAQAAQRRAAQPHAAARLLDEFTDSCVQKVVEALGSLLAEWEEGSGVGAASRA